MKRFRSPGRMGFFAMLAALLGITSGCKGGGSGDDIVCMYGVPTVSYELKGKVTDEAGKPVEGIEVRFDSVSPADSAMVGSPIGPSVATDGDGQWSVSFEDGPAAILKVTYTDVDGRANGGEFAQDSTVVRDIAPVKKDEDGNPFNLGDVKLEMPDVQMKKVKR